MNGMMDGGTMFGMGLYGLLGIIVLVLVIAALIKYLFFSGRSDNRDTAGDSLFRSGMASDASPLDGGRPPFPTYFASTLSTVSAVSE